jgi:hypothetical protein
VSLVYSLFILITMLNRSYNGFKYVLTGEFLVYNSPPMLFATLRRATAAFVVGGTAVVAGIGGAAGLAVGIDQGMVASSNISERLGHGPL